MEKIIKTFIFSILIFISITSITFGEEIKPKKTPPIFDYTPLPPTKVFDDLYCIGTKSVVTWVLKTSQGLVMMDSMWDTKDAKLIEKGMIELGLNPADVKCIIVTHGHGDHYGGAKYFREKYGSEVIMTKKDYQFMIGLSARANSERSPKPQVDVFVKNEDVVRVGDKDIKIIETPGHTPGCLSTIFTVKNNGVEHTAFLWGGTGYPKVDEMQFLLFDYKDSVDKFEKYTKAAGADIQLVAHLYRDNGYAKLEGVRNLKTDGINPFIIGTDGVELYFQNLRAEVENQIENLRKVELNKELNF